MLNNNLIQSAPAGGELVTTDQVQYRSKVIIKLRKTRRDWVIGRAAFATSKLNVARPREFSRSARFSAGIVAQAHTLCFLFGAHFEVCAAGGISFFLFPQEGRALVDCAPSCNLQLGGGNRAESSLERGIRRCIKEQRKSLSIKTFIVILPNYHHGCCT